MKIGIVGRGALGVMYGWLLSRSLEGDEVFFIADEKRVLRYREQGVFCNGERCEFHYRSPKSRTSVSRGNGEMSQIHADLLIFAVKFPGLASAVEMARCFVQDETVLLSVMNGMESENVIGASLGTNHLLYCVVHGMDAMRLSENQFAVENTGTVVFGHPDDLYTEDVAMVKRLLDRAKIRSEVPDNIKERMWSKLMLNTGVNQVAAVYGTGFEGLQRQGEEREMARKLMKEVQLVARAEQVELDDGEIDRWFQVIDTLNPKGKPSMQQDVEAGKETEVELFSGAVIRLAERHGIEAPYNKDFFRKIKAL